MIRSVDTLTRRYELLIHFFSIHKRLILINKGAHRAYWFMPERNWLIYYNGFLGIFQLNDRTAAMPLEKKIEKLEYDAQNCIAISSNVDCDPVVSAIENDVFLTEFLRSPCPAEILYRLPELQECLNL